MMPRLKQYLFNPRWASVGVLALIFILGFLIYGNVLHGEFQFDDKSFIVQNKNIKDISDIPAIWKADRFPSRFLTFLTFAANFHFNGLDTFGYHLVNVLIHLINAFVVFCCARLILSSTNVRAMFDARRAWAVALVTALIFLAHPLQTQAVSYISQRFASVATLFYLLSFYFFVKGRMDSNNRMLFVVSALSAVLAMLSKEISFTLPFMLIMADYCLVLSEEKRKEFKQGVPWPYVFMLTFLLITPLLLKFNYQFVFLAFRQAGNADEGVVNSLTYLLTQFHVIPFYMWLFIFPWVLNLDYEFPLSTNFFEPGTIFGVVFIALLLFLASRAVRRHAIYAFCLFWFFISLIVEASILPIPHVIFEHRMYLPSMGLCLLFAVFLFRLVRDMRVAIVVAVLVIAGFSYGTHERNKVWQTEISLWSDVVKKSPHKSRPYDNLAAAHIRRGEYALAKPYLLKAMQLNPKNYANMVNLAQVYLSENDSQRAKNILMDVVRLKPFYGDALNNLGLIYMREGNFLRAEVYFKEASKVKRSSVESLLNLGALYRQMGLIDSAKDYLNQAYEKFQDDRALFMLLELHLDLKEAQEAKEFLTAIHQTAHDAQFFNDVAGLCALHGLNNEAASFFAAAIRDFPKMPGAYAEMGKLFANTGRTEEAFLIWSEGMKNTGQEEVFLPLMNKLRQIKQ